MKATKKEINEMIEFLNKKETTKELHFFHQYDYFCLDICSKGNLGNSKRLVSGTKTEILNTLYAIEKFINF